MWGRIPVEKQTVEGNDLPGGHGYVCEGDSPLCRWMRRVSHGMI